MNIKQEQYDLMLSQIANLKEGFEKVSKEKEQAESMRNHYKAKADDAEKIIEQMHLLLDGMEGTGERKAVINEYGQTADRMPMTRLAQWLASRIKPV